jgi:hypothetical protein
VTSVCLQLVDATTYYRTGLTSWRVFSIGQNTISRLLFFPIDFPPRIIPALFLGDRSRRRCL